MIEETWKRTRLAGHVTRFKMAESTCTLAAKSRDCTGLSLEDKNSSWPQWHMIIRFVTSWCVCVVIKAFKSYCIASHRTVKAKDLELSSWSLFVVLLWTLNIPVSDLNQSNKQFSWFTSPNVLVTFYRADASVQFLSIPLFNLNAGIAPSSTLRAGQRMFVRQLLPF